MQPIQLAMFFGRGRVCGHWLHPHAETKKQASYENIAGSAFALEEERAVIGPAAACRSLKKLDRLCD
jgi:hypothetical protein